MMKKTNFVIVTALYMLLSACAKNMTSINVNSKAATNVPSATLFTMGEKRLVDYYTSTSVAAAPFRVLAQEWTENGYVYEAQYNFAAYNAPSGWWNNLFELTLPNLQTAKLQFPSDVPDAGKAANNARIADILEVYAFDLLLNTYGNIPYSQALNNTIPFPVYDDAKTVYADLLHRLDTCISGLDAGAGSSLGAADLIYGGDVTMWKKFAATLELKLGIRLADVDATTASTAVGSAITAGVFASNADNPNMPYDPSAVGNSNPIWQALVNSTRHDFCPDSLMVATMVGWNDPRLPLYFTTDSRGGYSGGTPGNANGFALFSQFSAQMKAPAYPGILLSYSQVEFWKAEAVERGISSVSGTAESHYDNAITASIEYWGGAAADAATYLAQPEVAYSTATGAWQQKLGYQEWLANFNMNWDSWTDIRRLGYPNLDALALPTGAHGNFPLRFYYPSNESGSNSTNWKAAVAALPGGADVVSAKLFWMK